MRRALAAAVCAVVAACAPLEPADGKMEPSHASARTRPATPTHSPDNVMAYLAELRKMGDAGLHNEIARQRKLLARDGGDIARTRLAAALSLSASGDEAEILALVEPVARRETAPADARALASFLQVMATERRRLKESAAAAQARVREERKAADAQKQRADTAQERAAQLQQKLDALTQLEKSLSDRPTTTTR